MLSGEDLVSAGQQLARELTSACIAGALHLELVLQPLQLRIVVVEEPPLCCVVCLDDIEQLLARGVVQKLFELLDLLLARLHPLLFFELLELHRVLVHSAAAKACLALLG